MGRSALENVMTITLSFPPDTERELRELAAASGQTVEGFVRDLVERQVVAAAADHAAPAQRRSSHAEEVLEPLRREFEESGMSEEELTRFLTEVRGEVRQEKRAGKAR
jgi:DNA-binding transcriptional regulator YhcF (GntR family)